MSINSMAFRCTLLPDPLLELLTCLISILTPDNLGSGQPPLSKNNNAGEQWTTPPGDQPPLLQDYSPLTP